MNELFFFIGYDSKEDIAYRVCKYSLQKRSSIKLNIHSCVIRFENSLLTRVSFYLELFELRLISLNPGSSGLEFGFEVGGWVGLGVLGLQSLKLRFCLGQLLLVLSDFRLFFR